jgi:hypothetical protein
MHSRKCILGFLILIGSGLFAQEDASFQEMPPWLQDKAVVLDIAARVVEQDKAATWDEAHKRITIPGRPVGIKLAGANVVVAVQFTPFVRRHGQTVLVIQGQIWVDIPDQGIRYQTTMQTIPLEFEEPIYFFPLGPVERDGEAYIEIMLTMRPYKNPAEGETQANLSANETQGNNNLP